MSYNSGVIVLVISNHSPDYSLNCTPLSPITITNSNDLIRCMKSSTFESGLMYDEGCKTIITNFSTVRQAFTLALKLFLSCCVVSQQ